jgi:hypothetical protein
MTDSIDFHAMEDVPADAAASLSSLMESRLRA